MHADYIVIFCTVPDAATGSAIAEKLVGERLAACVNITGEVSSVYTWKGQVCRESELLLVIKSRRTLFGDIERAIRAIHPYEVPEIIAMPVLEGHAPYLAWIDGATSPS